MRATREQLVEFLKDRTTDELPTLLGNALFNLYHKVQKLNSRLCKLVPDVTLQIEERHSWFRDCVIPRLDVAIHQAEIYITRYVESDDMQPICKEAKFTASAVETLEISCRVI